MMCVEAGVTDVQTPRTSLRTVDTRVLPGSNFPLLVGHLGQRVLTVSSLRLAQGGDAALVPTSARDSRHNRSSLQRRL